MLISYTLILVDASSSATESLYIRSILLYLYTSILGTSVLLYCRTAILLDVCTPILEEFHTSMLLDL